MFSIFYFPQASVILLLHEVKSEPCGLAWAPHQHRAQLLGTALTVMKWQGPPWIWETHPSVSQMQKSPVRWLYFFPAWAFRFQTVDLSISFGKWVICKPLKENLNSKFTSRVCVFLQLLLKRNTCLPSAPFYEATFPTEAPTIPGVT